MATIAIIFGSITGLLSASIAWLVGASSAMVAAIWLLGCLCGCAGSIASGLLRGSGAESIGDVIAADLRALGALRAALPE